MQLSGSESVIDTIHGYHLQIVITVMSADRESTFFE